MTTYKGSGHDTLMIQVRSCDRISNVESQQKFTSRASSGKVIAIANKKDQASTCMEIEIQHPFASFEDITQIRFPMPSENPYIRQSPRIRTVR